MKLGGWGWGSGEKDHFLPVSGQKTPVKRVFKKMSVQFSLEYLSHVTWLSLRKLHRKLQFIFYKALKCFLSRLTVATAILRGSQGRWASYSRCTNRFKKHKGPKASSQAEAGAQLSWLTIPSLFTLYHVSCLLFSF